jgi:outer membrane protein assembly factor BamB
VVRVYPAPFTGPPTTLRPAGAAVDGLAFSADGKTLYAAYADRSVGVWDVAAGEEAAVLKPPAGKLTGQYGYAPPTVTAVSPDGARVVGVVGTVAAWAWDVKTGKILWERRAPAGADPEVGSGISEARPAFAPDGTTLYLGLTRGAVGKFDPATGAERGRVRLPEAAGNYRWDASKLAISPDGTKLLAQPYYNDGHLYLIDLATDRVAWRHDFTLDTAIVGLAFTPDGRAVLSTHADGQARTLDAATGRPVDRFRVLPTGAGDFALSADGSLAVAAAPGATALVWALTPR